MTDPLQNMKVLIPMIRKVAPNLMAQQITGVQPMDMDVSSMYPSGFRRMYKGVKDAKKYLNKTYWPYQVTLDVVRMMRGDHPGVDGIEHWCYNNFKSKNWRNVGYVFAFKREADYTMFLLKWQ